MPPAPTYIPHHANAPRSADTFAKHAVDKPVPVEALIKCKMQDNLEFLQFAKRYWDQYYPGGDYDAPGRRKGSGAPPSAGGGRAVSSSAARKPAPSNTSVARARTPQSSAQTAALQQENAALKETVAGLERERDFYFSKLRDIELLIQTAIEQDPELEANDTILKSIQTILYSTEVRTPTAVRRGKTLTHWCRRASKSPPRARASSRRKRSRWRAGQVVDARHRVRRCVAFGHVDRFRKYPADCRRRIGSGGREAWHSSHRAAVLRCRAQRVLKRNCIREFSCITYHGTCPGDRRAGSSFPSSAVTTHDTPLFPNANTTTITAC